MARLSDTIGDVMALFGAFVALPVLITYGIYTWSTGQADRLQDRNRRLNHESDTRIMVACLKNSRPQDCNYLSPIPLPQ